MHRLSSDGKCIDANSVCNFKNDCADKSDEAMCGPCDFESGLCGWTDLSNGKYNFSRHAATQNHGAIWGPPVDHTSGAPSGHYVFVEGTQGVFLSKAILQSPSLPPAAKSCHSVCKLSYPVENYDYGLQHSLSVRYQIICKISNYNQHIIDIFNR